ncbi:hypothetical protein CIK05_13605 [Bdellovibrio sp. qaytius]|nr:hypothetical protein CIK05_13605 [Bdellovibrio sp. qaytius]
MQGMDYFRTDCIKSYFELVALVNKGNKIINEQTEAVFFIKEGRLFLGVSEKQKMLLCYEKNMRWLPDESGPHGELKSFIASLINAGLPTTLDVNKLIKENLFKLGD